MSKKTNVLSFPSDINGCGFYRTFIPFNYLMAAKNFDATFMMSFVFDVNFISRMDYIRFQRQVTTDQKKIFTEYANMKNKINPKLQMVYELDDLVHGIEPHNILAYQFYTVTRKNNMIDIMKMSDKVTFSTQFLKDFYESKYNIGNSYVIPNLLPKYMWKNCGNRDKYNKSKTGKLRILWAGSSSHVAKGGDLEFLVPLIKKTANEFEWVFFGTKPSGLHDLVEFHPWANFYEYPQALDSIDADVAICPISDTTFNLGKSDLKVLEYSAIGLPCVCSTIGGGKGPYDLIPNLKTVENKIDDWYEALKELEQQPELRVGLLEYGLEELNKRWLEDNAFLYTKVYSKQI